MTPQEVVDDLDPAENGEAGEETHCASDQSKLGLRCHLELELEGTYWCITFNHGVLLTLTSLSI